MKALVVNGDKLIERSTVEYSTLSNLECFNLDGSKYMKLVFDNSEHCYYDLNLENFSLTDPCGRDYLVTPIDNVVIQIKGIS